MRFRRNPPRPLLLLLIFLPSVAHADGCFVWRNRDADVLEPEQKALIIQDHGWEDLVLEVKYQGKARDFGWIVPVPSEPTLNAENAHLFQVLSEATQDNTPAHAPKMRGVIESATSHSISVLQESRVGIYQTATLSATDGAALTHWLKQNDYHVEPRARSILDEYSKKGWLFVAARIDVPRYAQSSLNEGTIEPLRIGFHSAEPVFPLRISAAGGQTSDVLLYVISRRPLGLGVDRTVAWKTPYSGPVPGWIWNELDPDTLFADLRRACVLAKFRADVSPERMRDVTFAPIRPADVFSGTSSSPDAVLERGRAAAMLGASRDTSSVPALIRFVRGPKRDVTEIRSGLWALGQIGTDPAMREVAHWIGDDRDVLRQDAISIMESTGSRAGIDASLARMASAKNIGDFRYLPSPEFDYLLNVLRPGDLPKVNAAFPASSGLRKGRADLPFWCNEGDERDYLRLSLGDPFTLDWYCDSLVSQGQVTGRPDDAASARLGSTIDDSFPRAFWTGAVVAVEPGSGGLWGLLGETMQVFRSVPQMREAILHRLAMDPRLPEAGRVICISYAQAPTPAEHQYLRGIWRAARSGQEVHLHTGLRFGDDSIDYPKRSCLVAYTCGRHHWVNDLLSMWGEVRGAAPTDALRGEVAFSLAMTDSAAALEPVVEYVRSSWDVAPGLVYRDKTIREFLTRQRCSAAMAPLIEDSAVSAYTRIFWISNLCLFTKDEGDLVNPSYTALDQIEQAAGADTQLGVHAHSARAFVDRYAAIRRAMAGY
jgi:hypothetical protein